MLNLVCEQVLVWEGQGLQRTLSLIVIEINWYFLFSASDWPSAICIHAACWRCTWQRLGKPCWRAEAKGWWRQLQTETEHSGTVWWLVKEGQYNESNQLGYLGLKSEEGNIPKLILTLKQHLMKCLCYSRNFKASTGISPENFLELKTAFKWIWNLVLF